MRCRWHHGRGDRKQIIKGDAYYQSYICHLPRGVIEMALDSNLVGIRRLPLPGDLRLHPQPLRHVQAGEEGKFTRYFDYPQNFTEHIGGTFFRELIQTVQEDMFKLNGVEVTPERLNHAITLYNHNRRMIEEIYDIRQQYPWRLSAVDTYYILRRGAGDAGGKSQRDPRRGAGPDQGGPRRADGQHPRGDHRFLLRAAAHHRHAGSPSRWPAATSWTTT
ncbi:MAG: 2-hydroxyacyl-CoA dehydratase [Flavobacteriales bacterium]|nr:2-hydroxyacyl-CoA dehydratase [Flavobacteriales bacterium]